MTRQTTSVAALEPLRALVGEWVTQGSMPRDPAIEIRGRSVFEWLDGGTFLVLRWSIEPDEFPNGIAILRPDAMHYFDSRGVARVYEMSLRDGVWPADVYEVESWV